MRNPLVKAMQNRPGAVCYLYPCVVTQVSPLLITINGLTNVPAGKIAGAAYSLGQANALYVSPGPPIVLPIG